MSRNPWIALGTGLLKLAYTSNRANSRVSKSIDNEERELFRALGTLKKGLFDNTGGIVSVTTYGIRFEKMTTSSGRIASGSVYVPLGQIRRVSSETGILWGGQVIVKTGAETMTFEFNSSGDVKKMEQLVASLYKDA